MEHRQLGRTGVRVTPLCLGTMNFGMPGTDDDESIATIRTALDAGINFVDTANVYSRGRSEEVVGRAIAGRRDEVVLATKVHGAMSDDGVNDWGNSRRHVKRQCEASLRRLQTDWIDVYQLHRPDPTTPIDESLEALDELVREGKVAYVGLSTFPAWEVMEAIGICRERGLRSLPATEQPPYNLLDRRIERDLVPLADRHGLGIIPWSPLAGGALTGRYLDAAPTPGSRMDQDGYWGELGQSDRFLTAQDTVRALAGLASEAGTTLLALALAWLVQQPGVTAPIIGPRDRAQLEGNLAALEFEVDDALRAAIDEVVAPGHAVLGL